MSNINHIKTLEDIIIKKGGFSNSHAHLDRAFTVSFKDVFEQGNKHLFEKWKLVDKFKKNATIFDYIKNIESALNLQREFNVKRITTFIDVDSVVQDKAINAAVHCKNISKEKYDIDLKLACQTLKGVLDKKERSILESNIDKFDIIGSLPRADKDVKKHLDYILTIGKETNKKVHVHVDQLNTSEEKETELLCKMTMRHGMEGMVSAVHSISLASHPLKYRKEVYKMAKDSGMNFISCPTAWIDAKRNEILSVTHNAITPADEMSEYGLNVCIGSDNIFDIYKPFSDGNIMTELRFLLECNHFYKVNELIDIATVNYLKTV